MEPTRQNRSLDSLQGNSKESLKAWTPFKATGVPEELAAQLRSAYGFPDLAYGTPKLDDLIKLSQRIRLYAPFSKSMNRSGIINL